VNSTTSSGPNPTTPVSTTSNSTRFWLSKLAHAVHLNTHRGFALAGVACVSLAVALGSQANLRQGAEEVLLAWLQERQDARLTHDDMGDTTVAERVTTVLLHELPEEQAKLTAWIGRKYRVAPDAMAALVAEAYALADATGIEPTAILAVMAVESRFNPFAQSSMGAQGLMQVLTRVHTDKYEPFGGRMAAFDPLTNLRVGVKVLQDCVDRAGSLEGGLRLYVGAVSSTGQFYVDKVFAVQREMAKVTGRTPMFSQQANADKTSDAPAKINNNPPQSAPPA
jgi:soluble lytic murein transglycosylase-like protein